MSNGKYDITIVGGGIVGLATALNASSMLPRLRVLVLEKEPAVAQHQSGHNSGVIHSGIYYKPQSLKARLCVEGAAAMVAFCTEHSIPHEICGKLIVATDQADLPRLNDLLARGRANGIHGLRLLSAEQMHEIEPYCGGICGIHVPTTGITDYKLVCEKYAELIVARGVDVITRAKVRKISARAGEIVIETSAGSFTTKFLINCAGLQSDLVARLSGKQPRVIIVPFRGEYYELVPEKTKLVKALIYPVPDPRFPFLGVHFTRRIHGGVDAGPNAVFSFKREGYRARDFSVSDTLSTFTWPGFWRMGSKYWKYGAGEFYRSFYKPAFTRALQELLPDIQDSDLLPGGSGVRAQALERDGSLVDDFQFVCSENMLHVCNVPSPAATASLPIGREVVRMATGTFGITQ